MVTTNVSLSRLRKLMLINCRIFLDFTVHENKQKQRFRISQKIICFVKNCWVLKKHQVDASRTGLTDAREPVLKKKKPYFIILDCKQRSFRTKFFPGHLKMQF